MNENSVRARVVEVHKNNYLIRINGEDYVSTLSGKLFYAGEYPVVGDYVSALIFKESNSLIVGIEPRTSFFSRPDKRGHSDGYVKTLCEQAMFANFDYVFIITSLNDDFSVARIARYAAITLSGGGTPIAILTKADLCPNKEDYVRDTKKINEKLEVVCVSSYTGTGLDELKKYFRPGVTIGLLGSSGAGKSTLINTLACRDIMTVQEIRESDSKGRHTTTHRQLIDIRGTFFIDTPGMRELGLCDVEKGIDETFDDIADLVTHCRFSDCRHENEPGCAVRSALESGALLEERWNMYCRLQEESKWSKSMKQEKLVDIAKKRREFQTHKKKSIYIK